MVKKTVLIIGGFRLPQENASAVRALGNARLLFKIGYDVILVGKIQHKISGQYWYEYDGFKCFDIECAKDKYGFTIEFINKILGEISVNNIYAMIAYNFPGIALNKLIKTANKLHIAMISDTTEWYAWDNKIKQGSIIRNFQTEFRMRYVNKKIRNLICSTYYIADYYKHCRTVIIPMIDETSFSEKQCIHIASENRDIHRFIYAGSPGHKFNKDKIDVIVKCFRRLKKEHIPFEFNIYGITQEEYSKVFDFSEDNDKMYRICFHGRVPRNEIQEQLKNADFYVLFRPNDKVCRVGFSTKAMEAISNAVPLIANDVNGDFRRYFTDGQALICGPDDTESFYQLIKHAAMMPYDDVNRMKENCIKHNPFDYQNFYEPMKKFMEEICR